jgi:hypothetical protein
MNSALKSVTCLVFVFGLIARSVLAQSSLPACQGSDVARWTDCFGSTNRPNNTRYIGEWKDGKYNGAGTLTIGYSTQYIQSSQYIGQWKDGKRSGLGIQIFFNGTKYSGEYKEDRQHGLGTLTFTNGEVFTGQWKEGSRHWGSYTTVNSEKYVGEWKGFFRNGKGIAYDSNGSVLYSGDWSDDKFVRSFSLDKNRYPFDAKSQTAIINSINVSEINLIDQGLEFERNKRQELEQQIVSHKERDRITAELEAERRKRQELEAQLVVQPPTSEAIRRNAHALVIGNGAYPGSGRLDNPVNDANAISQKLSSMGFTVTTVTDANRQKLVQSMAQFRRTAAAADISLLFYAGHGVQIFGTNYILPTDVDQTDPAQATIQGVSLNSVVENFLPGKTKLVFLDACRDNALQRTSDRSVSKGLAPISAAEGTLISYATKDGQTAADGAGSKNSPFTQALLEHINDPQDIAVVLRKVREKVMKATGGKQQPWEYGSLTGGELVLSAIKPK